MKVMALTRKNWSEFGTRLQEFESIAEYPYGSDFFRISHGPSYISFFERLGEPLFHVALDGEKIVACAAGILRNIPGPTKSWYLCDLKVHPDYRNKRIPAQLFRKNLLWNYLKCPRAYAVSMNTAGKPNRVAEITNKFPFVPISLVGELNMYSLDFDQMNSASKDLSQIIGPISFLSLTGKKDLIMRSTKKPMNLLHVQHGPLAEPQTESPQRDFIHMICAPNHSKLDDHLQKNFAVAASASILAHRMSGIDWKFILTSDI